MAYMKDETSGIWFRVLSTPFEKGLFLPSSATKPILKGTRFASFPGGVVSEERLAEHPWLQHYLIQFSGGLWGPKCDDPESIQDPAYRVNSPAKMFDQKSNATLVTLKVSAPMLEATVTIHPGEQILATFGTPYTRALNKKVNGGIIVPNKPYKSLYLCPTCGCFVKKCKKRGHIKAHQMRIHS